MQVVNHAFRYLSLILAFFATCSFSSFLSSEGLTKTAFSTLYGGSGTDDCDAVAVDRKGNTFLGCHLNSPDLPGSKKYGYSLNAGMDAFVIKLDSGDHSVGYITHWGGEAWDAIQGIVSDADGNVFAVGVTYSEDLPVSSSAAQPSFGGSSDIFVVKLDPAGRIVWTTYFGGDGDEDSSELVLDEKGKLHIAGRTSSTNLLTNNDSFQKKLAGGTDAFIATFDTDGNLHYVTYLGGSGEDIGAGIAIDSTGRRFISGFTDSSDFPVMEALDSELSGNEDAFVAVLNSQGNVLEFSTYLGGSGTDRAIGVGINPLGEVIIAGGTSSADMPTIGAAQAEFGGISDVFIARININKPELEYLSYFGGNSRDRPLKLALTESGKAVIVGDTISPNFPISHDFRSGKNEEVDGYIAIFDTKSNSAPFSLLSGGTTVDTFEGIAIGADGSLTVTGASNSIDFPTVAPIQAEFMGGRFDILVAKFHLGLSP